METHKITEFQARQFCYQNGLELPDFNEPERRTLWMKGRLSKEMRVKLVEWMRY